MWRTDRRTDGRYSIYAVARKKLTNENALNGRREHYNVYTKVQWLTSVLLSVQYWTVKAYIQGNDNTSVITLAPLWPLSTSRQVQTARRIIYSLTVILLVVITHTVCDIPLAYIRLSIIENLQFSVFTLLCRVLGWMAVYYVCATWPNRSSARSDLQATKPIQRPTAPLTPGLPGWRCVTWLDALP